MHLYVYVLTLAEDEATAIGNVRGCLEEQVGETHWFDYASIDDSRDITKLSEVRQELIKTLTHLKIKLQWALDSFDRYRAERNTGVMGYQARRISEICCQKFSGDMPFWNMETDDWELPKDDDFKDKHGRVWYAVPVDLHC